MQMTRKWKFKQKGNAGIEKFGPLCTVQCVRVEATPRSDSAQSWSLMHRASFVVRRKRYAWNDFEAPLVIGSEAEHKAEKSNGAPMDRTNQ